MVRRGASAVPVAAAAFVLMNVAASRAGWPRTNYEGWLRWAVDDSIHRSDGSRTARVAVTVRYAEGAKPVERRFTVPPEISRQWLDESVADRDPHSPWLSAQFGGVFSPASRFPQRGRVEVGGWLFRRVLSVTPALDPAAPSPAGRAFHVGG